jgi:hypothetical protein
LELYAWAGMALSPSGGEKSEAFSEMRSQNGLALTRHPSIQASVCSEQDALCKSVYGAEQSS